MQLTRDKATVREGVVLFFQEECQNGMGEVQPHGDTTGDINGRTDTENATVHVKALPSPVLILPTGLQAFYTAMGRNLQ